MAGDDDDEVLQEVVVIDDAECRDLMEKFIADNPELWNEDIGEPDPV